MWERGALEVELPPGYSKKMEGSSTLASRHANITSRLAEFANLPSVVCHAEFQLNFGTGNFYKETPV